MVKTAKDKLRGKDVKRVVYPKKQAAKEDFLQARKKIIKETKKGMFSISVCNKTKTINDNIIYS